MFGVEIRDKETTSKNQTNTLKMDTVRSYETSWELYRTVRRQNAENFPFTI
jgi:hypothetical protein